MADAAQLESVRVDKWLWAARFFKTRSLASAACNAGHVKVDGQSAKPARTVRRGDRIVALTPGGERIVDILELADKRGPAPVARALYEDHTPPPPSREEAMAGGHRDRGLGRPSKRDLRKIREVRGH